MANLQVYQLGVMKYPLHLHKEGAVFDTYGQSSQGKTLELSYAPRRYAVNDQWMPEQQIMTIESLLIGNEIQSAEQIANSLRYAVGAPTNIIAYTLSDVYQRYHCSCFCEQECHDCEPTWWSAIGKLVSFNVDLPDNPFDAPTIVMKLELYTYWSQLDRYTWQWGGSGNDPFIVESELLLPYCDYISDAPSCGEITACASQCKGWVKRNFPDCGYTLDPDFWTARISGCSSSVGADCSSGGDLPSGQNNGAFDGCGVAYPFMRGNRNLELFNDYADASAPPEAMYAFTHLERDKTITIATYGQYGQALRQAIATIDLADLDSRMAVLGYTQIMYDDILYLGDLTGYSAGVTYRPAFIVRSGNILPNLHPVIEYPTWYPGFVPPGRSRITIQTDSLFTMNALSILCRRL